MYSEDEMVLWAADMRAGRLEQSIADVLSVRVRSANKKTEQVVRFSNKRMITELQPKRGHDGPVTVRKMTEQEMKEFVKRQRSSSSA